MKPTTGHRARRHWIQTHGREIRSSQRVSWCRFFPLHTHLGHGGAPTLIRRARPDRCKPPPLTPTWHHSHTGCRSGHLFHPPPEGKDRLSSSPFATLSGLIGEQIMTKARPLHAWGVRP